MSAKRDDRIVLGVCGIVLSGVAFALSLRRDLDSDMVPVVLLVFVLGLGCIVLAAIGPRS
jgi:hypothetical protein